MLEGICAILILVHPLDGIVNVWPVATKKQQQPPLSLEGGKTIEVSQFVFVGNQAVPKEKLETLTTPYLNRAIAQSDIGNIKQSILFTYRNLGYDKVHVTILSMTQKGVLKIVIVEGKKTKH